MDEVRPEKQLIFFIWPYGIHFSGHRGQNGMTVRQLEERKRQT